MNKEITIIVLLIIMICLFVVTATIAFTTRTTITNNIITFGNLKMELIHRTLNEKNEEVDVNNNANIDITYNSTVSRVVRVKNIGKHNFFARVSINVKGIDENKNQFNANSLVSYDVNTNDWIFKDGWYYYKKELNKNEMTSNLITQIKFDIDNITSNYPNGEFKININAEAVQAENNEKEVLNVVGWPSN